MEADIIDVGVLDGGVINNLANYISHSKTADLPLVTCPDNLCDRRRKCQLPDKHNICALPLTQQANFNFIKTRMETLSQQAFLMTKV